MKVSTGSITVGYLQSSPPGSGKRLGQVTNFVWKAEAEAKTVTNDAVNPTAAFTNWMEDTVNKF